MSAYSDWKCGAISDDQYRQAYMMDRGEDHGEEPYEVWNGIHGQVVAPAGTFDRIWEEALGSEDEG